MTRAIVGRHQEVEISIAIEVAVSKSSGYLRPGKVGSNLHRDVRKALISVVEEKMRGLRIVNIAANKANCFIDVSVRDNQVEALVKVDVNEGASKPERVP